MISRARSGRALPGSPRAARPLIPVRWFRPCSPPAAAPARLLLECLLSLLRIRDLTSLTSLVSAEVGAFAVSGARDQGRSWWCCEEVEAVLRVEMPWQPGASDAGENAMATNDGRGGLAGMRNSSSASEPEPVSILWGGGRGDAGPATTQPWGDLRGNPERRGRATRRLAGRRAGRASSEGRVEVVTARRRPEGRGKSAPASGVVGRGGGMEVPRVILSGGRDVGRPTPVAKGRR